jgi:NAD(P)-dependent dehydrogenase (short-subunit alcohol dehydrogenase family)
VLEGRAAIGMACEVADEAQVAAMVDRAVGKYGRLDMAFNNAGIQVPPSDAADEPIEHFERVTAVNQRGVWACMKHELRVMHDQGYGAIVNCFRPWAVSSASATRSLSRDQACRARHDQERGC